MQKKKKILIVVVEVLCICLVMGSCLFFFLRSKENDEKEEVVAETQTAEEGAKTEEIIVDEKTGKLLDESEKESVQESETLRLETEETIQTETAVQTETNPETEQKTVAIDPGHQGSWVDMSEQEPMGPGSSEMKAKASTGTSGRYTDIPEYELNLDISLALRDELESRGYAVIMTRTDNDAAISNKERAEKAYKEGGDVYVRIHANGDENTSMSGALGMVPSPENSYVGDLAEESYRLAECIVNAYCEKTEFNNLGIQYYDNMTGINWSQIPVMILEMGFMTNESDDRAMADKEMRKKMVIGIADGIDQYFGGKE